MQIAHDDLIACVERNRVVVESKRLKDGTVADHATIEADIATFLKCGGRITEIPQGVSVESGLRCVTPTGGKNLERRWQVDTRKPAEIGEGLATWRGRNRIMLPGTLTTPKPRAA